MFILLEHQYIQIGKNLFLHFFNHCFFCRIPNQNLSIEEIFKSRLDETMNKTTSSLLRGEAFNLHLRGWSYDPSKFFLINSFKFILYF